MDRFVVEGKHPEDIKAAIRKRFGSLKAFEEHEGLPRKAVTDILRGRSNRRVSDAIRRLLAEDAQNSSINVDDSAPGTIVQNPKQRR